MEQCVLPCHVEFYYQRCNFWLLKTEGIIPGRAQMLKKGIGPEEKPADKSRKGNGERVLWAED